MNAFAVNSSRWQLALDRMASRWPLGRERTRVLATICWQFPIYSQTFVYEELTQMVRSDFDVKLIYNALADREGLPTAFAGLWDRKRLGGLNPAAAERDYRYYTHRMPQRVDELIRTVCDASGMTQETLLGNEHFLMAFSYTRLADAFRPHYLHSYFFYEGTYFTFVASHLLNIPRGVSCYADHMLADFSLKMVPLHLATCDIVVATSERIAQELLALHPAPDAANILVKPNAIDTERFPLQHRTEPSPGEPFQLVCVARLEPKKGLLDLVHAVQLVGNRGYSIAVHVIGANDDTPEGRIYRERLEALIVELGVQDCVTLHGRQTPETIRRHLLAAHLFVAPFVETATGDKDGIPTALLEAMSTGAAVLVTDAGSMTEPIRSGVNGEVVPQRDASALADGIIRLLEQPARRAELGQAASETVRERYDVLQCDVRLHQRIRGLFKRGSVTGP